MRKTLLVLTLILLFLLTACSADPPRSAGSDSESTILIVSPTEDETVSDPTEQTKESEETHDTKPSLPQTNEDKVTSDSRTETTGKDTGKPPTVSEEQKEISKTDVPPETESSKKPTETTSPPATEKTETNTEPTETIPPPVARPSGSEVAAKVAVYINQYRGSSATVLPGLGSVALYRANELVSNFAHTDGIDACNALQYGEFVDMTLYGMSESDSYYQGYNREAIAKGNWGGTADEIAQRIATGFKNSASHWKYLGSSEYLYMAVGCVYDEATSMWYCCICVSTKNYGG